MPHKSFGFSEGSVGARRPRRCILTLGFGKGAGVALRRERWKGRVLQILAQTQRPPPTGQCPAAPGGCGCPDPGDLDKPLSSGLCFPKPLRLRDPSWLAGAGGREPENGRAQLPGEEEHPPCPRAFAHVGPPAGNALPPLLLISVQASPSGRLPYMLLRPDPSGGGSHTSEGLSRGDFFLKTTTP